MKKRYLVISIVSMLVLIVGVSVAYFNAKIVGTGKDMIISVGKMKLAIKDGEVKTDSLMPILDSTKETKANTQTFTVERTSDSSIKTACYTIYLVIDNIGDNLKNKFFKYELLSNNNIISSGDFNNTNNEDKIELVSKQKITEETGSNTYTLRLWFSYDEVEDQTKYLQGSEETRTFTGHIYVSGNTGECPPTLADKLVDNWTKQYGEIGKREHFDGTVGDHDTEDGYDHSGVYYEDDKFTEGGNKVYYFSGNVTNNWVSFAGFYWRIIRTNEDGSIRLLYGGLEADKGANDNQYIGSTRAFNSSYRDPMYVGFKYGTSGNLSNNRTNETPAPILGPDEDTNSAGSKVTLNGWYKVNMNKSDGHNNTWDKYISRTAIYCNDRSQLSIIQGSVYYMAYGRLSTNKRPSFKCGVDYLGKLLEASQAEEDKFSGVNSKAKLENPIGLMTADEVAYAGGLHQTNLQPPYVYYYNNADGTKSATGSRDWWTMSPYYYNNAGSGYAAVYEVGSARVTGGLSEEGVYATGAVRPVISLKSCVTLSNASGEVTGDKDDPYVVQPISAECAAANN